ncbi:MAG: alpha-L-rhamnosidase N-terminal domain-containing protein, partial [Planctomycetota bacterium]
MHQYQTAPAWTGVSNDHLRQWQWQQARWICAQDDRGLHQPSRYFLARHAFDCRETGRAAEVHIAADSDFRLYCNGRLVGQGAPRDTTVRMSYRSYDVSSSIRTGRNCLAVVVYATRESLASGRSAFICALAIHDDTWHGAQHEYTGNHWRAIPAPQWDPLADESTAFWQQTEVFDARAEPADWTLPDYDDSTWPPAQLHDAEALWPHLDTDYRPHSQLVPAVVEPLRRSLKRPLRVVRVGESITLDGPRHGNIGLRMALEPLEDLQRGKFDNTSAICDDGDGVMSVMNPYAHFDRHGYHRFWDDHPGEVPMVRHNTIVLDFGELMNAHLYLDLEAVGGEQIDIA